MSADTLASKWWGLRFLEAETESAYRRWAELEAVPFVRVGMIASLVSWAAGFVGLSQTQPLVAWWMAKWFVPIVLPSIVGALALTWSPRGHGWLFAATALANASAGAVIAGSGVFGLPDVSLAAVILVNYFAFTIFRLPVRYSLPTAAVYVGGFAVLVLTQRLAYPIDAARQLLYVLLLGVGYTTGALASIVLERVSRNAFRLEKMIAAQRATIEGLLKQEISHQVAERSRALSESLAKVDVALPSARLEPGRPFDSRYVVVRELGRGGMGAVYEVERLTDHQHLALKVVTGDVTGAQGARFAREAEIGARVKHRNLVQILDVGVSPAGAPFLVMELVPGKSLEDHRARFGDRAWAQKLLPQIADGLAALHDAGVVHRDLKPANVLLSGELEAPLARISDFGISRFGVIDGGVDPLGDTAGPSLGKGHSLTRTGAIMGTPLYMAPEAARGGQHVDKPADVFALGIVAYELLSGRLPFEAPVALDVMAGRTPSPAAALDGPLGPLVLSCLSLEPGQRPQISDVCAALARV